MYSQIIWNTVVASWQDPGSLDRTAEGCLKWAQNADTLLRGSGIHDEYVSAILDLACMIEQGIYPLSV